MKTKQFALLSFCALSITALEIVALSHGINGIALASSFAALGSIGGFAAGKFHRPEV